MNLKLQVFISSTYTDLIAERQAAVEAILKAGHIPAGMELFTAGDKSQWEVIKRWITDSDVYMLILGGRYGSIEPQSGLSYTEMEYDFAVHLKKPHFAVVISDDALQMRRQSQNEVFNEMSHLNEWAKFREKVLGKMSSFFSDSKDIKLAVLENVPKLCEEYDLSGWVRGADVPDTAALSDELLRLNSENRLLTSSLDAQAKELEAGRNKTASIDTEFAELRDLLSRSYIDISAVKNSLYFLKHCADNATLLDITLALRDILICGITNQDTENKAISYIYYRLCPKLHTHDLMQNEKETGTVYRRYSMTKKGTQFLAFIDRKENKVIL